MPRARNWRVLEWLDYLIQYCKYNVVKRYQWLKFRYFTLFAKELPELDKSFVSIQPRILLYNFRHYVFIPIYKLG